MSKLSNKTLENSAAGTFLTLSATDTLQLITERYWGSIASSNVDGGSEKEKVGVCVPLSRERVECERERQREVWFGRQPESESGLLRCGSSGYPLASGHINDHSSHMALQSIWAKWPRSTL